MDTLSPIFKNAHLFMLLLTMLVSPSCGELTEGNDKLGSLQSFRGTVVDSNYVSVSAPSRLVVLWNKWAKNATTFNNGFVMAQDTALTPHFPAWFTLNMEGLPPSDALLKEVTGPGTFNINAAEGGSFAVGGFLVYEDLNRNEQYDAKDRVIGGNKELLLVYFEGSVAHGLEASTALAEPQVGYNLVQVPWCHGIKDCPEQARWLGPEEGIALVLNADVTLSEIVCLEAVTGSNTVDTPQDMGTEQPDKYPVAEDTNCSHGGSQYVTGICESVFGACETCVYKRYHLPSDKLVPDGWPCDVDPNCFDGTCDPGGCSKSLDWEDNALTVIYESERDGKESSLVKVSWSPPEGANALRIARTEGELVPELTHVLSELSPDDDHFVDSSVSVGACYQYRVFVMNGCGDVVANSKTTPICLD